MLKQGSKHWMSSKVDTGTQWWFPLGDTRIERVKQQGSRPISFNILNYQLSTHECLLSPVSPKCGQVLPLTRVEYLSKLWLWVHVQSIPVLYWPINNSSSHRRVNDWHFCNRSMSEASESIQFHENWAFGSACSDIAGWLIY